MRFSEAFGRCLFWLLFSWLVAGCVGRADPTGPPPEPVDYQVSWFDCDSDSECEVIHDASCTFASVNRRFTNEFRNWVIYELYRLQIREPCLERAINYEAICDAGKCSSVRLLDDG